MRDFGFGRRFDLLERQIQAELVQYIDVLKNGPIYPHEMVILKLSNWNYCFISILIILRNGWETVKYCCHLRLGHH